MKDNLLIITPVSHIKNFLDIVKKNFNFKLISDPSFNELKKIIYKYDFIFTNPNMSKIYFDKKLLKNTNIRAICTASTGTSHIDLQYIHEKKIKLISLKDEKKLINKLSSTAELAFGLTLNAIRKINLSSQSVLNNKWSYLPFLGNMFSKLKIGIIGYGRLGRYYAKYCLAFGAEVFVYDPYVKIRSKKIKVVKKLGKNLSNLDVISINIHATKSNINFIDKKFLNYLKKNVNIINTARGEVINENHLIKFLNKNKKATYSADVLANEQRNISKNLLLKKFKSGNKQIFLTPHIGGMTFEGQEMAYHFALKKLINFKNIKN